MSNGSTSNDLTLAPGGPSHWLAERLGLGDLSPTRRVLKILLLILVAWGPLLVLSLMAGLAFSGNVKVPLFYDPDAYGRFLFAIPMLELGSVVVARGLAHRARCFLDSGILPEGDFPRFWAAQAEVTRLRDSTIAETVIVILSLVVPVGVRMSFVLSPDSSSWDCVAGSITTAGWWYVLVSLPIVYLLVLRRVWVFLLWGLFLYRVSRLNLQLTATHPDRAGGLGFIGQSQVYFVFLILAVSAIISAGLADEILNRGESLNSLKYHVALFVALVLVIVHLPLLAFSARLGRCRTQSLLSFGTLAGRHDRAFEEKWLEDLQRLKGESLLGSADVQTLANVGVCYEHVDRMWVVPMDLKASMMLVVAALIPMVPLLGTEIPLQEILMKLGELLL